MDTTTLSLVLFSVFALILAKGPIGSRSANEIIRHGSPMRSFASS